MSDSEDGPSPHEFLTHILDQAEQMFKQKKSKLDSDQFKNGIMVI